MDTYRNVNWIDEDKTKSIIEKMVLYGILKEVTGHGNPGPSFEFSEPFKSHIADKMRFLATTKEGRRRQEEIFFFENKEGNINVGNINTIAYALGGFLPMDRALKEQYQVKPESRKLSAEGSQEITDIALFLSINMPPLVSDKP